MTKPGIFAHLSSVARRLAAAAALGVLGACAGDGDVAGTAGDGAAYEYAETRGLVALVNEATQRIEADGEAAFPDLRVPGSRWRRGEAYVFVLDPDGTMLVHPDPALEGRSALDLRDVNGRPIVRGLIDAATASPGKPDGWYHYEWPAPGGLLPRWKSSYVRVAAAPTGRRLVVGSGMYDDRMERAFVVDMVDAAVARIESLGETAYPLLRDRTGPFMAKDAYVFVVEPDGVEVVNPAFPNLEGRNLLDVKDTEGKPLVREMLDVIRTRGSGWVEYMWPQPGESVSTRKSAYVRRADRGGRQLLVGAGVYLADAPKSAPARAAMTVPELQAFVRDAAALFTARGEAAFAEFRVKGSKWFHGETYVFVWSADGRRVFNAPNPSMEGLDASGVKDVQGRPYGRMFLDVARSPSGEGWVHYVFPEPGGLFPRWKSSYLMRATPPSGGTYVVGCGIYEMQMDRAFVEDLVARAAALLAERGRGAFATLRDPHGPFVFMDTYVFVDTPDGVEVVNAAQPSLEGKNLIDIRDVNGKELVRDYIAAAREDGPAWIEYHWYRPGRSEPSRKLACVRRVRSGPDTYIVGSGFYVDE
jgi:signal transduction histidine kinase